MEHDAATMPDVTEGKSISIVQVDAGYISQLETETYADSIEIHELKTKLERE